MADHSANAGYGHQSSPTPGATPSPTALTSPTPTSPPVLPPADQRPALPAGQGG